MKNNYELDINNYTPEKTNCKEKLWSVRNRKAKELEEKISSQKKDLSPLETQLCKKLIF